MPGAQPGVLLLSQFSGSGRVHCLGAVFGDPVAVPYEAFLSGFAEEAGLWLTARESHQNPLGCGLKIMPCPSQAF